MSFNSQSPAVDQQDDLGGREVYRISEVYKAPDFVKGAALSSLQPTPGLGASMFADGFDRKYPLHNAAATWVSAAFFLEKAARDGDVDFSILEKIRRAARTYKVAAEVTRLEQQVKDAADRGVLGSGPADFAVTTEDGGAYPLRNATEVKVAADYYFNHRDELPFSVRQQFAENLLRKAADYGADLAGRVGDLERAAGRGIGGSEKIAAALRSRIRPNLARDDQEKLAALAAGLEAKRSPIAGEVAEKIAGLLDRVDAECNLRGEYGRGLERPEDVVFEVTTAVASKWAAETSEATASGSIYRKQALAVIPAAALDIVRPGMSAEVRSPLGGGTNVEKLAECLVTLDRRQADVFDAIAAEHGVAPAAKRAAREPRGRDERLPDLDKAAAEHRPPARPGSLRDRFSRGRPVGAA